MHHLKAIGEFKLELQYGNAQFGSKSAIFSPVWPWNLMDDLEKIVHFFYVASSFVHHFVVIGEFKLALHSSNAQFGSKSTIFLSRVTLKIDGWHWKTIEHLSQATPSFVHHFIFICEFKLELRSRNGEVVFWPLWPWLLTSDLNLLHGNHSWKFQGQAPFFKIQGQDHGEVNVESHNMCPTFYQLTSLSFHVNRLSHSWDTTFSKFDLENLRSRSWVRSKLKVTKWV